VILHNKIDEEYPTYAGFDSGKWFWLSKIDAVAVAGKRLSSAVHLQKRV
jgi:hypothetical protein